MDCGESEIYRLIGEAYKDVPNSSDVQMGWVNLVMECKKNVIRRKVEKLIQNNIELSRCSDAVDGIQKHLESTTQSVKELRANKQCNLYAFITISPKSNTTLDEFKKLVEKWVNRSIFTEYLYVFEQRGVSEDEIGKGFHAHALVKRNLNYKPSKIKELTKNSFKNVCNVQNPACLNIKWISSNYVLDKQGYLLGEKSDEGKPEKQDIDKVWRLQKGLQPFYKSSTFKLRKIIFKTKKKSNVIISNDA